MYLWWKTCYTCPAAYPCPVLWEGRCCPMAYISTFILSVGANVASYYICKWLDGWLKGRSTKRTPFEIAAPRGSFPLGVPMTYWLPHLLIFIICDSPQKSSTARKIYNCASEHPRVSWRASSKLNDTGTTAKQTSPEWRSSLRRRSFELRQSGESRQVGEHPISTIYRLFYRTFATYSTAVSTHISGLSSRSTVSSSVPGSEVRQSARCTSRQAGRVRRTSSRRTAI